MPESTEPLPLIVQSDHTILLEVDNSRFAEARDRLLGFAELVKSPEHLLSTGMADWSEIDGAVRAVRATGARDPLLLHCVTSYLMIRSP